jgi:hypothetical protein
VLKIETILKVTIIAWPAPYEESKVILKDARPTEDSGQVNVRWLVSVSRSFLLLDTDRQLRCQWEI